MRKRLGEILAAAGLVDELQLRSALAEAARWGKRVGEVLVARGHCTDAQILEALASQLGVGVAQLAATLIIPPRVLRLLPPAFAREKQVLPLALDGRTGTLEVAVADPAGYELLDELRFRTGHEIRPLVAMPTDLADAINHFYFGAPRFPVASAQTPMSIDLPPTPSGDSDLFEHGIDTGEFMGKQARRASSPPAPVPAPSSSSEMPAPPPMPSITVQVKRTATGSLDAQSVAAERRRHQVPTPAVPEPSGSEVARLHMEVADLNARLDKAYAVLREAALAHRALLAELAARGLIDRESLTKRVREQQAAGREGER